MTEVVTVAKKRGPKPKVVDFEAVERLASLMYTRPQIAAQLGISLSTLEHFPNHDLFVAAIARGQDKIAVSIHSKQYEIAMKGNTKMLEILGREFLGQTQNMDIRQRTENVTIIISEEDRDL